MTRRFVKLMIARLTRQRIFSILLGGLSMVWATDVAAARPVRDEATKKVLIISSYDPASPGNLAVSESIRAAFRKQSSIRAQFYQEDFDISRIPESQYEALVVRLLQQKYEGEKIDLIFALGSPALKLLMKHRGDLLSTVPLVFYFFDETEAFAQQVGANATGVWAKPDYGKTLEIALTLHPDTEKVAVVVGNSPLERFLLDEARKALSAYEDRAQFTYLSDLTIEELQQNLASLPEKSIVLFLSYFVDHTGKSFSGPEALSLLAPTTNAPVYGIAKTYLGTGIVGGSLLDFEAIGVRAGELGLRVLGGEKPDNILSRTVPSTMAFDARALERWGISETNLPPGSTIRFKEPTLWERYKWWFIGGFLTVSVIETLLIAGLLINRARRRRAEVASERFAGEAREQRQKLNEVISNVPGIVWETRLTSGNGKRKVSFISDYVEELLGYGVEEWQTTPDFMERILHDEDREEFARSREAIVTSGQERTIQFRWRAKDGGLLWAEAHITPVFDETGKVVSMRGVTLDITKRKLAEEALRRSERRNQDIVRAIPDLMFLQTPDGDYLDFYAGDQGELLVPPEQFLGKNIRHVLPPELAEAFLVCFQRAKETGETQIHEYSLPMPDGIRWYEARMIYTNSQQILSVVRDVTERKRADAQLVESEERFRNMADTAPVMIWVSGPDKRCIYFNQSWLNFTGRSLEEELGDGWADGIHPSDFERCLETYHSAFERREPFEIEYRIRHADGQFHWVHDSAVPRFSSTGKFLGYIGSSMDINHSKQAEEEVRESQAQLAEIIGSAIDAIITVGKSRRIIHFNSAAEQMFGCAAQEAIGQSIDRYIPEQLLNDHLPHAQDFRETNHTDSSIGVSSAIYGRRADGEEFPAEASISQTELSGQTFYTIILRNIAARQQAEEALKESEANYRAIFNGVNDAIFIHDGETGAVLDVNQRVCEMYGVSLEEARRLTAKDLSANEPPFMHEAVLERIKKAAAGEPQLFEWRAKDKLGRLFWIEVSMRCAILGGKVRVLAIVHDITDRKLTEASREEAFAQVSELKAQLEAENIYLREEIRLEHDFSEIIGASEEIRKVLVKVEQIARTDTTVLILGETGTGKELVADAIHRTSMRNYKPLVKVNCATLPATLIESELFGHEKGAFTSATARQLGRFELANGGTIFLDEIGDLPLELQGKLLRVLQEGEFERLGSGKTIKVNARVIAATNRNLPLDVQKGLFREDLWYRLNVFPLSLPPLRERSEDIPLLVEAFVGKFSKELDKPIKAISPATLRALQNYAWPGNIRELANVIERAVINSDGTVLRLADRLDRSAVVDLPPARQTLEEMERQYILRILEETGWRIEGPRGAARILGLHPSTLRTRILKLGIHRPANAPELKLPPAL